MLLDWKFIISLFINRSTQPRTQFIAVADHSRNSNLLHIMLSFSFYHFLFFPLSKEILFFPILCLFSLLTFYFDMKVKVLINHYQKHQNCRKVNKLKITCKDFFHVFIGWGFFCHERSSWYLSWFHPYLGWWLAINNNIFFLPLGKKWTVLESYLPVNILRCLVYSQVRKFIEYTLKNKPQTKDPPHIFWLITVQFPYSFWRVPWSAQCIGKWQYCNDTAWKK